MSAENITSFNKLYNEYYDRFVRFANVYKIAAALKPLRYRVGVPAVDFDREYNTASDHPFKDLDKYIQAVRRERREETAYGNKLVYDQAANNNLFLSGKPGDAKRYIIPFNNKNYQGNFFRMKFLNSVIWRKSIQSFGRKELSYLAVVGPST